MQELFTSLRLVVLTLIGCGLLYPAVLLGIGQAAMPVTADGSLLRDESGTSIGSALIAQKFESEGYLWPRPSAVDYDAAAAGGSNLAPSNPALRARVMEDLVALGESDDPVPADLVTASGSGLDPHVTLDGALHQVERIARARGVDASRVRDVLRRLGTPMNPWRPTLVNVLQANLELDRVLGPLHRQPP